jgi:two-component system, response regulator PdtaR
MQPPCLTGLGSIGPLIRGPAGMAPGRGDKGPERPRGATRPPAGRQLQGVRVLIVEDEALVAINLETMLEDLGAEVCGTAASGADAVRKARQLRPEVAVVDIRLKDGETGVEAARTMADELGVAIVFASAHSDPRIVAEMAKVPGAGRLTKPYDAAQLADMMRRVLRRQ